MDDPATHGMPGRLEGAARVIPAGWLLGLAVTLIVVGVGGADGGFFPQTWRWTGLALLAAAGSALMLRERVTLTRRETLAVGILVGLAGWNLLSWRWSSTPGLAAPEAERTLLYAAALLAFLVVAEPDATLPVVVGLLGAATILSVWSLGDYVTSPDGSRPLVGPLGYANGAGEIAALGVVLGLGLAAGAAGRAARIVPLATLSVLVPALVLSASAGAWLALLAGLAVVAQAHWPALPPRATAVTLAGAVLALLAVWLARGHPTTAVTGNLRWSYWNAALHDYGNHPWLGSGAGSFGSYWGVHKTTRLGALDAHSLYVESLAELGPVGLAFVLSFVATALLTVRRAAGRWTTVVVAAFVTYAVHTGIDWDWELPATTLPGVVLAGLLLAGRRDGSTAPLPARKQLGLAAGLTVLAILALVRLKTAPGT